MRYPKKKERHQINNDQSYQKRDWEKKKNGKENNYFYKQQFYIFNIKTNIFNNKQYNF